MAVKLTGDVAALKTGLDWAKFLQIIQLLVEFFSDLDGPKLDEMKTFAKSQGCDDHEAELCALACQNLCGAMKLHLALHEGHT